MPKINPFSPNAPSNPGTFVGRLEELDRLESCLLQTAAGHPTNFMITGERGIGKTSLLNYLKHVAEGRIPIGDQRVSFLVVDTDIDPSTTQHSLLRKIQLGLERALAKTESARTFFKEAWSFLQRVEAGSVKLNAQQREESEELLFEEFSYSLADLVNRICGDHDQTLFNAKYDGILILIDEADNAGKQLRLGAFFKLMAERLQRRGCSRVLFGIAGLPALRTVLYESHQSSLRLFEELPLDRLSDEEVKSVARICLAEANRKNTQKTAIDDGGMTTLAFLSEGYPHFIQQFGSSAFAADADDVIDSQDVLNGAFGKGGALELIGDRYYRDNFYNKIQAESYRQVLRIMADRVDGWITKKEIKTRFKGEESTLNNALKALRDREIILPKEGEPGVYRLQHKGFAWWIKMYTTERTSLQQKVVLTIEAAESALE
jgi:hypothetical protein